MPRKTKIERLLEKYDDSPPVDRRFEKARPELERLSDKLYVPRSVKETAEAILHKALEKNLVRGRSYAAITAASTYAACHVTGVPRTLNEIAEESLADKEDVACCYRLLVHKKIVNIPKIDASMYIPMIAERTGISMRSQ